MISLGQRKIMHIYAYSIYIYLYGIHGKHNYKDFKTFFQMERATVDAPIYKIRITKKGRYFRIQEVLNGCTIPNIQVGHVIVSISECAITETVSSEELMKLLDEPGHDIKVINYRNILARAQRTVQRIQEQVTYAIRLL